MNTQNFLVIPLYTFWKALDGGVTNHAIYLELVTPVT